MISAYDDVNFWEEWRDTCAQATEKQKEIEMEHEKEKDTAKDKEEKKKEREDDDEADAKSRGDTATLNELIGRLTDPTVHST